MKNSLGLRPFCVAVGMSVFLASLAIGESIPNGDFSEWSGTRPGGWTVRKSKQKLSQATDIGHASMKTALQVDLIKDGGSGYGEILRKIKFKPYTRYRVSADVRSTTGGLGIIQVKVIRSKRELERLNSARSGRDWTPVSLEFDTVNADEVQVLCRYNQKGKNTGETIWWTNLQVEELGPGEAPKDPNRLSIAETGTDQYVTASGAGDQSGSSFENARPGTDIQAAVDAAGAGKTVYIGSGSYGKVHLNLTAGGAGEDQRLRIIGKDTGGGLPQFASNFTKENPGKTGGTFLRFGDSVGFVSVEGIRLEDYGIGVLMYGPNRGVRLKDIQLERCREGIIINGGAIKGQPKSGTHNLLVEDCRFTGYTKRGIRIRGGVFDAKIINCHADSGGEEWAVEAFPMGFTVESRTSDGVSDYDITYERCSSRSNWHKNGSKYWNADGFTAEGGTHDITWRDCIATGNTDGGWDIKARNPTLINCVSIDNKRNFRFWSPADAPAKMVNCLSAYSNKRGGSGNRNGLHVTPGGNVIATNCTFVDTGQAVDMDAKPGRVQSATLEACLIVEPKGEATTSESDTKATLENCIVIAGESGDDPAFPNARADFDGSDNSFDSSTYPSHGYRHDRKP